MARKKQEEAAHGESWLMSYCDMISLLVTFFLMMMTFSTNSEYDVREIGVGLLKGRGGIWKNPISFPEEQEVDPQVVTAMARDLAAIVASDGEEQTASVKPLLDGFTISFDLNSSFAPGSAQPTDALRENLSILAGVLSRYTHLIVVEGFTDDHFKPSEAHSTAEALGIARACAAARILLENGLIDPALLQVATAGELRPRASNDTAAGRQSNRRVEVRVVSLARPRPLGAPAPRAQIEGMLDAGSDTERGR